LVHSEIVVGLLKTRFSLFISASVENGNSLKEIGALIKPEERSTWSFGTLKVIKACWRALRFGSWIVLFITETVKPSSFRFQS
jgi:hypothetical protein